MQLKLFFCEIKTESVFNVLRNSALRNVKKNPVHKKKGNNKKYFVPMKKND